MKKEALALCLLGLALASCGGGQGTSSSEPSFSSESSYSSASLSSSEEQESTSQEESSSEEEIEIEKTNEIATSLCLGSVAKGFTFPTLFFSVAPDVPYFEIEQFADLFNFASGTRCLEGEGNTIHNVSTSIDVVFDAEQNTISTEDLDQALNFSGTLIPGDPLHAKNDAIATLDQEKTTYAKGKAMSFRLSDYKTKIIEYNNKTFVPFAYLNALFCISANVPLAFNGDDYYLIDKQAMVEKEDGEYKLTDYGESFFEGSLSEKEKRSESYASYFYYSFVFQMQYFNGKIASLGIGDLDAKLEEMGLKERMLSSDSKVADEALANALSQLFHDGGHTGYLMRGMTCPFDAEENQKLSSLLDAYDTRFTEGNEKYEKMKELRGEKTEKYEKSGETALIHLDSFDSTASFIERGQTSYPSIETLQKDYESENPSTFALLYFTFKEIEKDSSIKNVVFDVSMNGGGEGIALAYALSFMSDDPVKINFKNTITGATYSEAVNYDNDLDQTTGKDSYQGDYHFYILTSGYSFSCANAFPCIAKDNGLATIIGERSGGGDCEVKGMTSIEGSLYQTSWSASIRHEDGTDVDGGQEVDHAYPMNDFYDVSKLDSFIANLAD